MYGENVEGITAPASSSYVSTATPYRSDITTAIWKDPLLWD
jgi:hypothetical protein